MDGGTSGGIIKRQCTIKSASVDGDLPWRLGCVLRRLVIRWSVNQPSCRRQGEIYV